MRKALPMKLTLPRAWLNDFHALCRRVHRRARHLAVDVSLSFGEDGARCRFVHHTLSIECLHRAQFQQASLLMSLADLDALAKERRGDVVFELTDNGQWTMHWTDRGIPQRLPVRAAESEPEFPSAPSAFIENEARLLSALADCSTIAVESSSRWRLDCVCLCGDTGTVAATDGRQLLEVQGFKFPWTGKLLVPAFLALGSKVIPRERPVRVSTPDQHRHRSCLAIFHAGSDRSAVPGHRGSDSGRGWCKEHCRGAAAGRGVPWALAAATSWCQ